MSGFPRLSSKALNSKQCMLSLTIIRAEYAPEALIVMHLFSREENEAQVLEGAYNF